MGNPSYRARLMEKKTSDVSLSFCQGVFAVRRSRSSSRSRSRYQDGGDCRDRPNILCHGLRSALIVGRIFVWDQLMREALLRKFASSRGMTQDKQRRQSNGGTQVADCRLSRGGWPGFVRKAPGQRRFVPSDIEVGAVNSGRNVVCGCATENRPPTATTQLTILDTGWDSPQNAFTLYIAPVL